MSTKIEWTDETWNPLLGCEHVSPGCDNCYAAREASGRLKGHPLYVGLAEAGKFTGIVRLVPDRLTQPVRWAKPRRIFVNSMSDAFHKDVPDEFIARIWAVMAVTPRHHYQLLTKRHGRMRSLLRSDHFPELVDLAIRDLMMSGHITECDAATAPRLQDAPLPNVWLGVSVEDQARADLRVHALLDTPAAVRFLSCEPLLGPVKLGAWLWDGVICASCPPDTLGHPRIGWVIVGGESGPGARPMHPTWARQLRDECVNAGVPYLFKQWGEWTPDDLFVMDRDRVIQLLPDGSRYTTDRKDEWNTSATVYRVGKHHAGRTLDGRTWDEYPDETPVPVA